MFKSVYTRYIVFVSLLLVFSFTLLVITLSVIVSDYSERTKESIMSKAADGISVTLASYRRDAQTSDQAAGIAAAKFVDDL